MLLEVRGLTKRFMGLTAVSDVSFTVEPGEIMGIIGPNGSGKTTLLSMMAGLLAPTAGAVRWQGEEIQHLRPDVIAARGIVKTFQNPQVFAELTVFDNAMVATHLALKRSRGARRLGELVGLGRAAERTLAGQVAEALALCNLGGATRQLAGNLSYGEEKMLGLAMALMCRPRLLLLDEPASGLGREEIDNLVAVLTKVHAAGATLCIVDHKVGFLRGIARRVIALDHGEKIAEGPPEAVLENPAVIEAYLGRAHAPA
ncbi:MAG: ABC transporter ATP-binding protein [Candidatus Rokubacteria bacterium]|nr:ABC transporter ATP-binding protein [Candidatus Rokubacteria bacterium]MBI3826482.1 ABC transporter ATP-binding protein [Candidatus Rokubacteria bacterium]